MEVRTRQEGEVLVVGLEGELDAYWAGETRDALWSHLERGQYRIVLDLSGLTYLSSAGLRILLQLQQRISSLRGALGLAAPQPFVREVLDASGFARALRLFGTVAEATAAVRPEGLQAAELWSEAQDVATPAGMFQFRRGEPGTARLRVVGQADDLLYSRASPERLTTVHLGEAPYTLGIGALGPPVAAAPGGAVPGAQCPVPGPVKAGPAVAEPGTGHRAPGAILSPEGRLLDRLGELLTVPGAAYWLPGDGRQVPDFLLPRDEKTQLPMHLLCGMVLEGPPRAYGRFTAADLDAGAELGDLSRSVLDWASRQERFAGLVGLALRAEVAGLWGVGLKRSPRKEHAPVNGRKISHRENIRSWLHFPTEPTCADHTLIAVGVLVDPSRTSLPAESLEAALGAPETDGVSGRGEACLDRTAHVHGAVFRRVPDLGGDRSFAEELGHIVEQGELVSLAHLLPGTRLRRGTFAVWVLEEVRQG